MKHVHRLADVVRAGLEKILVDTGWVLQLASDRAFQHLTSLVTRATRTILCSYSGMRKMVVFI